MLPDFFTAAAIAVAGCSLSMFLWGVFQIFSQSSGCM